MNLASQGHGRKTLLSRGISLIPLKPIPGVIPNPLDCWRSLRSRQSSQLGAIGNSSHRELGPEPPASPTGPRDFDGTGQEFLSCRLIPIQPRGIFQVTGQPTERSAVDGAHVRWKGSSYLDRHAAEWIRRQFSRTGERQSGDQSRFAGGRPRPALSGCSVGPILSQQRQRRYLIGGFAWHRQRCRCLTLKPCGRHISGDQTLVSADGVCRWHSTRRSKAPGQFVPSRMRNVQCAGNTCLAGADKGHRKPLASGPLPCDPREANDCGRFRGPRPSLVHHPWHTDQDPQPGSRRRQSVSVPTQTKWFRSAHLPHSAGDIRLPWPSPRLTQTPSLPTRRNSCCFWQRTHPTQWHPTLLRDRARRESRLPW